MLERKYEGVRVEKPGIGVQAPNYGYVKCSKIISGKGTENEVVCGTVYEKLSPNTRYCPICRTLAEQERDSSSNARNRKRYHRKKLDQSASRAR